MTDYKRHLKHDMKGNFEEIEKSKLKTKPREIENEIFLSMVIERDRLWYKEGKFREHLKKRYGKE